MELIINPAWVQVYADEFRWLMAVETYTRDNYCGGSLYKSQRGYLGAEMDNGNFFINPELFASSVGANQ